MSSDEDGYPKPRPVTGADIKGWKKRLDELTIIRCRPVPECEHVWGGWRAHEDGRGGEQFCQKCGLGAMAHSLSQDW